MNRRLCVSLDRLGFMGSFTYSVDDRHDLNWTLVGCMPGNRSAAEPGGVRGRRTRYKRFIPFMRSHSSFSETIKMSLHTQREIIVYRTEMEFISAIGGVQL